MFNFWLKNEVKEIIDNMPKWEWKPTQTPSMAMLQSHNELIETLFKENKNLKEFAKNLRDENERLSDVLKSIEEDGTTEHNNAIKLRQEVASLEAFQKGLIHERDTARDLVTKLTKDLEDQKQLKDSLQRVNEKYIKKITEQEDSISELAKEVNGLRHLKTENVELIEKLLEKEGKRYGITFNEAKTQIIQNDYKKCAEERDEYKHQLNAANKEIEVLKSKLRNTQDEMCYKFSYTDMNQLQKKIDALQEERDILKRWKYEQLIVNKLWDKVDEYVRNHDDAPLGNFVANTCLDFLKERDELKAELEKLKKDESQKHPMYPLHWGGYDKNIIDFVKSEFSNEDPLEGKQVKQAVESLKNMKSQGFEDYDPSDFEQPVKEVEFNSEELLKRATEYADSLDSLPKSFPDEFQDEKTTAENLEERFDAGKNVLDYFDEWKCPCNKCKEAKTEKSWEEAASDLALKVAKLEKKIEELSLAQIGLKKIILDSSL